MNAVLKDVASTLDLTSTTPNTPSGGIKTKSPSLKNTGESWRYIKMSICVDGISWVTIKPRPIFALSGMLLFRKSFRTLSFHSPSVCQWASSIKFLTRFFKLSISIVNDFYNQHNLNSI